MAGRIRSIEKSNDIANGTHDLPACIIVPYPTMLSHAPSIYTCSNKNAAMPASEYEE
jgi:hypothetical protein